MRKVVAHLIITLDGVVDTIVKLRDTEEVRKLKAQPGKTSTWMAAAC